MSLSTKINFVKRINFFTDSIFRVERTKQMTEQEINNDLGKSVFNNNIQKRETRACLGQTCARSLIVFLSQLFVIFLNIFGCFWKIRLPKTCDESTVWVGNLWKAEGYL